MFEERSGGSSDLSSTGASSRSAHHGGLPGLLFDRDAEASVAGVCTGIDSASGFGKVGYDSNAGCFVSDDRWSSIGDATLYRAGPRAGAAPPSPEACSAPATGSSYPPRRFLFSFSPTQNVVETLGMPLLKLKEFSGLDAFNCEGWVNAAK